MTNVVNKNQVSLYTVGEKEQNQRLDNFLIRLLKTVPKSHIYQIIRSGQVRVNKKRADASYKVQLTDIIRIPPQKQQAYSVGTGSKTGSYKIPPKYACSKELVLNTFPIIYEDDYFLVIDKPAKTACHGGSGISFGVIEQLRKQYGENKFLELVHRLDKDTSGLLMLAKKRQALVAIQQLIRSKQIKKYYIALVKGQVDKVITTTTIKLPLTKYLSSSGERLVKVDSEFGKDTQTSFKIITSYPEYTLLEANLKTGHTHQIRVHLQHLGYPIIGDPKYGDFTLNKQLAKLGFNRMFLHAERLEFIHPFTQQLLILKAPLPESLQELSLEQA